MAEVTGTCGWCGFDQFEEGWLSDFGQGARGFASWIAGPLQTGFFGVAKWRGKSRHEVSAARCLRCSHLEFFVRPPAG
jgi:hypothetical protein